MNNIDTPTGNHAARFIKRIEELERENAALRVQLDDMTDQFFAVSQENAALRHSEENLASTVRGLEMELEKAQKEIANLRK